MERLAQVFRSMPFIMAAIAVIIGMLVANGIDKWMAHWHQLLP